MFYQVLNSNELKDLRTRLKITTNTADHLFGLEKGTYEQCETGLRQLTSNEDNLIRETNCFDEIGNIILPDWMVCHVLFST